jgi:aryl-alcohol dehydrogenase-like predicted oxidoreductase
MKNLDNLVKSGKVLHLGISDTPAWLVVKCNDYARQHGLTPFSVYQGQWSAAIRDFEREIIPMCQSEGMGIAPWGALGGGLFKLAGTASEGGRNMPNMSTGREAKVAEVLDRVAKRKDTLITSIAMAYVMHKAPYVFPIVGGRKVEHLKGNIEALGIRLSAEDIAEIETGECSSTLYPLLCARAGLIRKEVMAMEGRLLIRPQPTPSTSGSRTPS